MKEEQLDFLGKLLPTDVIGLTDNQIHALANNHESTVEGRMLSPEKAAVNAMGSMTYTEADLEKVLNAIKNIRREAEREDDKDLEYWKK
jgi:hypothetical protein